MTDQELIRIGDKCLVIQNIISEGGYGFIYKASEIDEKDFNRFKIRSVSPIKKSKNNQSKGNFSNFLKGFKKDKKASKKKSDKKFNFNKLKKGTSYALKKMITQNNERFEIYLKSWEHGYPFALSI
jgi:ribosomal protein L14E/L6E/L27E